MSLRGHVNTKEHGSDNEELAIINYTTRHFRYILIRKERSAAENKRPTGIFDHSLSNYSEGKIKKKNKNKNAHKASKKYFYNERKFFGIARCHPDRLWGLTSLLFHGFRGSFPGVKRPGLEADNSLPSTAEIKSGWGYTSTPPIRLHDVDRDFTFLT